MSDLIRREDLIDWLTSRIIMLKGIYGDLGGAVSGVREWVKVMPSEEPDVEAFEWCHDCKEYDQEKHCCHRWTKVIRQTIEEMKAEPERKWIPVTEALPKDMDRLLATISRPDGEKRVRSGHYYKGYFMMDNGDTWDETNKGVLAWMPLPEPWGGNR